MATRRLPAEQRRRQLILSAIPVFARSGYHGATTRAIAEQAGVAEALLYRYFSGKRELFVAAVQLTCDRLVEGVDDILERHRDEPTLAIRALLGFSRAMLTRHPDMARMNFMVSAELDDPDVRAAYLPVQAMILDRIEHAANDWRDRGLVRPTLHARSTAWLILGSFQVVALMTLGDRLDELAVDGAFDVVADFLGDATAPQEPDPPA